MLGCTGLAAFAQPQGGAKLSADIRQITFGPRHHFFGYIGHVRTIPWNRSGRYIVALRTSFQDRMPKPGEAAEIVLLDTAGDYSVKAVEQTRAWNFQQGTMLYWNPQSPETQFFFNDRDPETHKVFAVLFDTSKGRRVAEYKFPETPFGNSGVAHSGGYFLGINYGRLARLRPVTGYPGAYDWTKGVNHPDNDGLFMVDTATKQAKLIVSFRQLRDALRASHPSAEDIALFLNHTLWNRDGDRIFLYARGNFDAPRERQVDVPFTVNPEGANLTPQGLDIGGHPEWEFGHRMIGANQGRQILYDTDRREVVGTLGDGTILPSPGGDVALSPDGRFFVNGFRRDGLDYYAILRRADSAYVHTRGFDVRPWTGGDLRCDPSPCWNRDGTQILFPAIADDPGKTRQLFLIRLSGSAT
jgi:hypothetical protein